jgi:hypothetical protein
MQRFFINPHIYWARAAFCSVCIRQNDYWTYVTFLAGFSLGFAHKETTEGHSY